MKDILPVELIRHRRSSPIHMEWIESLLSHPVWYNGARQKTIEDAVEWEWDGGIHYFGEFAYETVVIRPIIVSGWMAVIDAEEGWNAVFTDDTVKYLADVARLVDYAVLVVERDIETGKVTVLGLLSNSHLEVR